MFLLYTIVTNNPKVMEKYSNYYVSAFQQSSRYLSPRYKVEFVDGKVEEVLIKVRDLIHDGCSLISHPLPASIKLIKAPYRSVIVNQKNGEVDLMSLEIIENSWAKLKRHREERKEDMKNKEDYMFIDLKLLESALSFQLGDIVRLH